MLDFTSLASSSSGCAYRVSGGGASKPLLIDAGLRYELIQKGLDFKVSGLAGCLVSHGHGDHIKAVPELLRAGVECYASRQTWDGLQASACLHHRANRVEPRKEIKVGDWQVLPFEAVHDAPGTLGFVIGSPDGDRLLYLTDSSYSLFTFEGLTHLAIECNFDREIIKRNTRNGTVHAERYARTLKTHMSIDRLEDMLRANDLSKVEAIYLLHLSSANSNEDDFKTRIQKLTGKPVYVCAEASIA